ncbi:MAG: low molecular weight phosphotyrosine protein phosphatase [Actinobacteria bacterium]|nr:low molecular weight phosphotyrosine protein phosphatase [Actinomycetota bacterium]
MRVLFVCLGNICRSPTAEAATFEALEDVGIAGLVTLDSAGIGDWHVGNPPDRRMRAAADDAGLHLTGRARQVTATELADWDLILAMDRSNLDELRAMAPSAEVRDRVRLFREFDGDADHSEVPDPYYGGPHGFVEVVRICRAAAAGLADELAHRVDRELDA